MPKLKIGDTQHRDLSISSRAVDEKARTVSIAFSSEEPYERWWGREILDHATSSVRLGRIRDGGAVLVGHDTADQVGVVESVSIGSDRVGRAVVRFGKSARADEVFQDVVDGIRRKVSVGYIIHDLVEEEDAGRADDTPTFRVTDWEPLELSLVAVPADNSVGVGRHLDNQRKGKAMDNDDNLSRRARREQRDEGDQRGRGTPSELERINAILAAGDQYSTMGGPELARELAKEPGATTDTFKARMLERLRGSTRPFVTAAPYDNRAHYGEGARSGLRYGGKLRAFEREEDAHRAGMWFRGAVLGDKAAAKWCEMNGVGRAMAEGINSSGGATVPIEMSNAYIRLVEQYGVFRQNARIWPMNSDQLKIARRKTGLSVFFLGENDTATESSQGWDNLTLSAKKMGTMVRIPNELLEDSAIALVESITQDIALAFSLQEDQCGFIGDGSSTYGGMRGLTQVLIDGSHNAGKISAAAGHHVFSTIDSGDLVTLIAALPRFALPRAKFYCSSVCNALVFQRILAGANGNRLDILPQAVQPAFLGHPIEIAQVMPAGSATDYTNKVMLLFGDLNMSSAMGIRRDLQIRQSQDRYIEQDQTAIVPWERFDIVNANCGDNTSAGPVVGLIGA